ncbi:MAG: hypothetical protein Fues2KO_26650 [Fuerstiella sp.]
MIILLGGRGYVGTAFQQYLTRTGQPFVSVSRAEVNYADPCALKDFLEQQRPSFLINAAGFTGRPNVDACELQKTECLAGNAVLPGTIRSVCEDLHLPWGHVSSGCIYTGAKADGSGFSETDPPNFSFRQDNCSFYSGCKALGEEVLEGADQCYIWRLRIPFDAFDSPRNYITKMMKYDRLLNATNSLSHLGDFVEACVQCHTQEVDFGIYNLTNPGSVTTRQVVDMIRAQGLCDREFSFFESEDEFMQVAAKTPRSNCVLDTTKATQFNLMTRPVEDALLASMQNWVPVHAAAG